VVIEAVPGDGGEGPPQPPWGPFLAAVGALAVVAVLGLVTTAHVALNTSRGLRLDRAAMNAVSSPALTLHRLYDGLTWVSVGSVAVSLVACVMLAAVRRRLDLALGAVAVIGGANLTTQILKYDVFAGPELGQQPHRFPSGHTTVALSIALAAVIVAPPAWRWTVAIGVSATASLVGVALVLGPSCACCGPPRGWWWRPSSDVVPPLSSAAARSIWRHWSVPRWSAGCWCPGGSGRNPACATLGWESSRSGRSVSPARCAWPRSPG
jgi:hypothetical protein